MTAQPQCNTVSMPDLRLLLLLLLCCLLVVRVAASPKALDLPEERGLARSTRQQKTGDASLQP